MPSVLANRRKPLVRFATTLRSSDHVVLEATGNTAAIVAALRDHVERVVIQNPDRLQWATSTWDPLPFDSDAARVYARMFAAERAAGQTGRSRLADLLIASTAAANSLLLYTRNPSDFEALKAIIQIVPI